MKKGTLYWSNNSGKILESLKDELQYKDYQNTIKDIDRQVKESRKFIGRLKVSYFTYGYLMTKKGLQLGTIELKGKGKGIFHNNGFHKVCYKNNKFRYYWR